MHCTGPNWLFPSFIAEYLFGKYVEFSIVILTGVKLLTAVELVFIAQLEGTGCDFDPHGLDSTSG